MTEAEARELAALTEAMREASAAVRAHVQHHLDEIDVTVVQALTLQALARRGRMTLGELAAQLSVAQPNVTGIIDRLERDGLAVRSRSRDDKRVTYARLTEAGHEKAAGVEAKMACALGEALGSLSAAELAQLRALLEKIARAGDVDT